MGLWETRNNPCQKRFTNSAGTMRTRWFSCGSSISPSDINQPVPRIGTSKPFGKVKPRSARKISSVKMLVAGVAPEPEVIEEDTLYGGFSKNQLLIGFGVVILAYLQSKYKFIKM